MRRRHLKEVEEGVFEEVDERDFTEANDWLPIDERRVRDGLATENEVALATGLGGNVNADGEGPIMADYHDPE